MTSPRARSGHVRPRPPSTGRPSPSAKTVRPKATRVRQHRGLEARRRRLPLPTRLLLALSVLALSGAVFLTATGGISALVSNLGAGFATAFGRLIATPVPTEAIIVATGAPVISPPASAYTNQATVPLKVVIPADVVGLANANVKLYVALEGLDPAPVREVPVGTSSSITIQADLTEGRNDFTATIDRSGVESDASAVITVFLDTTAPKVTVKSPKNGSTVADPQLTLKAVTEPQATVIARNDANAVSVTATALPDGTFTVILPLNPGTNSIHLETTDLAGNQSVTDLSYVSGSAQMTARLSASLYRISVSHHPSSLQLVVVVTDTTGAPVAGASATFTLQLYGLGPVSGTAITGADGRASFTTPLVGTLQVGDGNASVLVTSPTFGQASAHVALTTVK
jgi:glucodextranase-like protein